MWGCGEGFPDHRPWTAALPPRSGLSFTARSSPLLHHRGCILHLLLCWTHCVFSKLLSLSGLRAPKSRVCTCALVLMAPAARTSLNESMCSWGLPSSRGTMCPVLNCCSPSRGPAHWQGPWTQPAGRPRVWENVPYQ